MSAPGLPNGLPQPPPGWLYCGDCVPVLPPGWKDGSYSPDARILFLGGYWESGSYWESPGAYLYSTPRTVYVYSIRAGSKLAKLNRLELDTCDQCSGEPCVCETPVDPAHQAMCDLWKIRRTLPPAAVEIIHAYFTATR